MAFIHSIKPGKLFRRYALVFCLIACASDSKAQAEAGDTTLPVTNDTTTLTEKPYYKLNKDFIIGGWHDFTYTTSRPLHWQKKDWLKFSAIMGSVGTVMLFDKKIKSIALRNQNNFTNSVANTVEPLGNFYGFYIFPAIYATGLVTNNNRVESIGLGGGKALVISTVLYTASKKLIRRRRPDASETPFDYALPFSKKKYTSSPSGHTTIIFTIATAFAEEFPEKKWVAPVAYSIASLTALSRIYHNKHWASDVILGAALGHFVTKAVYANSRKKHRMLPTFR